MGCFPSPLGRDPNGFSDWTFSTVRCWGEEAQGTYRLLIRDIGESCLPGGPQGWWQLCAMSQGAASPSPGQQQSSPLDQPASSPGDESLRPGTLKRWQLTLYGSSWSPAEMRERQR